MENARYKLRKFYIILILIFLYLPIAVIIVYSFNSNSSPTSAEWSGFTFQWYEKLFYDDDMLRSLENSLIIAGWSVIISVLFGTPAAFVMTKYNFRTKGILDNLLYLPLMLPEIILGIAFLIYYSKLGLTFGMITMVMGHVTFCIPYVVIMVRTRLAGFDKSLEEAARDLGANGIQTFLTVILPLIAPAIISAALLSFAMSLDDVVISFFTAGADSNTLPLKIYSLLKMRPTTEVNALCSVTIGVIAIILALYQFINRGRRSKTS